jgi:hypothetical protein
MMGSSKARHTNDRGKSKASEAAAARAYPYRRIGWTQYLSYYGNAFKLLWQHQFAWSKVQAEELLRTVISIAIQRAVDRDFLTESACAFDVQRSLEGRVVVE